VRRARVVAATIVALLLVTAPVSAQTLLERPLPGTPPRVPAQQLQPPLRAPVTLVPSIGAGVEYDDNILLDNRDRQDDFIFVFAPGFTFTAERPTWRFNAGYHFENRVFVDHPELSRAFDRQASSLDSFYRVSPHLTFSLDDEFTFDTGINAFRQQGTPVFATGRNEFWTNVVRPGFTWQIDDLTMLRGFLAWSLQRFDDADLSDTDSYHADLAIERVLSPRLRGITGYKFAYFDVDRGDDATTHTPYVGARYDFTPTLAGTLTGGPTFVREDGRGGRIAPYVNAEVFKVYEWGTAALRYTYDVGLAGGLGGVTDNQTVELNVLVSRVWRGLSIEFTPQYQMSESDDRTIDIASFSLPIRLTYQFTPWFSLMGGYAFYYQRDDSTLRGPVTGEPLARDVDQNRVFFAVLFGYPIRFD
jgi:hypothetical protein